MGYQRRWLAHPARTKAWVASRQIGKSLTISFEATFRAVFGLTGPSNLIVSHDDRASRHLFESVRRWARGFESIGAAKISRETATELWFDNGHHVISIPGGRSEAMRGYKGNVYLDEFAYHRDQAGNLESATPIVTRSGGVIRIASTPLSDTDTFWGIIDDPAGLYSGWYRQSTTIDDAVAEGIVDDAGNPVTVEELRALVPDTDRFNCEYRCIPLSDAESYLGQFLDAARLRYDEHFTGGYLYGGFDVARSANGDFAALAEVRRDGTRHQASPTVWAQRGHGFEAMQTKAVQEFEGRGWQRMAVDATGIGMETAERLQRKLGTSRCDAVTFTAQEKDKMMSTLRTHLELGQLALPPDQELLLDLRAIKRIVGQNSVRYDAKHDEARGHADRAWALALAVRAAGSAREPIDFSYRPQWRGGHKNWK